MMMRGLPALALIWMHSALALGAGSLECSAAAGMRQVFRLARGRGAGTGSTR